ncbi:MAG TPA: helix-turn-helix transcriptional regulator [Actinomycetes bacterium]|jgi:transcriptional regulator with XRE-family HTH domain|nr:helix-turn-helix transcriptional regulator [Actinomycetes bacterium]
MVVPADRAVPNLLLRQAREARSLTQDEVADGLSQLGASGATGGLVSKWERGICRPSRFHRRLLCRFFDASLEQLGLAGDTSRAHLPEEVIRTTLLDPARASIKLSWLVWYGTADAAVLDRVVGLMGQLSDVVSHHQGSLRQPAMRLLACGHEMLGKVAFDRLDYGTAYGHFLKLQQLGEALDDDDIRVLAAIHQGDLLRRRGEYELAVQRLDSAAAHAPQATAAVEGLRQQTLARAHAEHGGNEAFCRAIEQAEAAARSLEPDAQGWGSEFSHLGVLHEKAHGHTLLWEAEQALDIYTDTEPAFRTASLRDVGNFTILKAQAHAYAGNIDVGVQLAIEGLEFARRYDSPCHVSRVQRMYDRLGRTPIGSSARMRDLAEALQAA